MCPYKNRELPISVNTKLAALIGWPLGHSASAEMHNDAYAAMGLDAIYLPLPVEPQNVAEAVKAMETMGFMGCNVTIPHKVAVKELMDALPPSAAESGAGNTVLFKEGRRIGYNTDGTGFVHALIEKGDFHPSGKSCLMIGAGGAARGVASALAIAGAAKFFIANREEEYEMAERLADDMNALRPGSARPLALDKKSVGGALEEADFVVHATRLGMRPNEDTVAFDTSLLSPRHFVCDVVYSPRKTRLLREAAARGCRTLDGMWMLVYQGAEAVRIWTGMEPLVDVMAAGCERFLEDLQKH
ncbi:MAG: shikimate dehydrogenase [Cloacibacillus sp.]|nr:shikimate dehydrogenase [Cloacibacillus sp.]